MPGFICLITLAGFPATIVSGSTSCVTTLPAPTTAFSPTVTPGRMVAPAPIHARRQICTRLAGNYRPIFQIVVIGDKLNICGYLDVIVDSNSSCRHHQTTGHNDYIAPEFHVGSPDTRKRSFDATSLAEIREYLMQQFIVLFGIRHRMVQPEDILPQLLCFCQFLCRLIPAVDSQFFHKLTCLPVSPILRLALHLR